jgi:ABC-2 type transport system ATP-binding protein
MTSIVQAQDLTHRYGERMALDGFTLDVPAGSTFGLLGPNGSGKSTFISLLAAMERPQSGELRVFGAAPAAALRGKVGTVFQENAQDPLMTVGEMLMLAGRLFNLSQGQVTARATDLLERFGLTARLDDAVSTLSGGMRRRLEMARALLHDPPLLLLDEPTTGVDPGERRALWETLRQSNASANGGVPRTILLASNDLAAAAAVCDMVAFIDADGSSPPAPRLR